MTNIPSSEISDDPFNLKRFIEAQNPIYGQALSEIRHGRKVSHWMWFIFPQLDGLGTSPTAMHYALKGVREAKTYIEHPQLGAHLLECAEATLGVEGRTANQIFGSPDDLKLHSCATLFALVSPENSVFERVLEKFFQGERDAKTVRLLAGDLNPLSGLSD